MSYLLFVLAICTGGVITHVLVAPTPGPLLVAETPDLIDAMLKDLAKLEHRAIPPTAAVEHLRSEPDEQFQ